MRIGQKLILGFMGFTEYLRGIAARKQTGERLELLRNLIDCSNDCVFIMEPKWGRFLDANDRAYASLGYARQELLNMAFKDIEQSIPDDSSWREQIEELKLKEDLVIQGWLRRKDGTTFFAETNLKLVSRNRRDGLHRKEDFIIAFARDISERKRAEEALRESEKRLTVILESILTGVVLVDAETHNIVDTNPLATEMIGLPKQEIVGKMCHKFICPAEKGKCPISDLGQVIDRSERVLLKADGREIPIMKTVTAMTLHGHEYFVESFVDIIELKQAEQRQAQLIRELERTNQEVENANQELKDFAYIVSHDLKAPLRGIKTVAGWISADYADKLDDNGKEQMKLLVGRVDRMHNLIDGILQYSRVGRVEEEKVVVNLNELVTEAIDMIAPPENITITVENELPVIKCEQTRITQVFQNLLSNAVKYMDKPQGRIKVGCVEENGFWKFSVADNGPGIEEKNFERIFKIFQTLTPRDELESTGIGLTVAKKIVELYNGKIWVESKPGEGSTFFFILPKQEMEVEGAKLEANIIG
ncbi:MAG: PAS domain S-box protein [Sedimentisphaerales bacterium]